MSTTIPSEKHSGKTAYSPCPLLLIACCTDITIAEIHSGMAIIPRVANHATTNEPKLFDDDDISDVAPPDSSVRYFAPVGRDAISTPNSRKKCGNKTKIMGSRKVAFLYFLSIFNFITTFLSM